MIWCSLYLVGFQYLCQFFHLLSRQAVYDTALARILANKHNYLLICIVIGTFLAYFIIKVWTIKRAFEFLSIRNAKTFLYIGTHLVGSSSRKCNDRSIANFIYRRTDIAILWTEIVSPLRYTMCLINGIERNLDSLQEFYIFLLIERLRSYIQQLGESAANIVHDLCYGCLVERRVDIMCHSSLLRHTIDDINLVFHQRNKWRHNNCRAFHYQ